MERYVLGQDFNCKDWFVYDNKTDTYVCRDTKENCKKYITERQGGMIVV